MIKKLWPHARPYAGWIIAGVACSAGEAIFELLIPLVMSDIVDIGIATGKRKSFRCFLRVRSIKVVHVHDRRVKYTRQKGGKR